MTKPRLRRIYLAGFLLTAVMVVMSIAARPATAACAPLPTELGTASFTISVPAEGMYRFWLRMFSPADGADGVYLQVGDQQCQLAVGNATIPAGTFNWIDYYDGQTGNKIDLQLAKGDHDLQIAGLDPNVGADMVLLIADGCVPAGDGSNCSSLPVAVAQAQAAESARKAADAARTPSKQFPLMVVGILTLILLCIAILAYIKWEHTHRVARRIKAGFVTPPSAPYPLDVPTPAAVVAPMSPEPGHAKHVRLWIVIVCAIAVALVWAAGALYTAFAAASPPGYVLSNAKLASGAKTVMHKDAIGGKMIQFATAPVAASPGGSPGSSGSGSGGGSGGSSGGGSSGGAPSIPPGVPKNCANSPGACGYPDATNTGWQHTGVTLSVVTDDPYYITTPGAVIDAKDIRGCVFVMAANVTIKRSKITCGNQPMIKTYEPDGMGGLDDIAPGLVIEDVEFDGMGDVDSTGIAFNSYTVRRSNFHDIGHATKVGSNVLAEDNYVHDIASNVSSHNAGFPFEGGSNNTIRHNTILLNTGNGYTLAVYNQVPSGTVVSNVLIENNLLAGGNYIIYCGAPGQITPNLRVINNRFSKLLYPNGGFYGTTANCDGPTAWTNNYWDDTLAPVDL